MQIVFRRYKLISVILRKYLLHFLNCNKILDFKDFVEMLLLISNAIMRFKRNLQYLSEH